MANEILGATKYLTLCAESTWGTKPGTPAYLHLPVSAYNILYKPQNRMSDVFNGIFQRKHSHNFRGMPQGSFSCPMSGIKDSVVSMTISQYLMDWAFNVDWEVSATASKTAEWAEGPDVANKEANGLRINTATIEGSADSGVVTFSADVMGKTEAALATAQTLPADRELHLDCEFPDVTLTLGGSSVSVSAFQLQINNGLKVEYNNSVTPSLILKTQRVITFNCTIIKNATTYDAYRRSTTATELAIVLAIKGLHNNTGSTGTQSIATTTMARCQLVDVQESGGREDICKQELQFVVLKPDSSTKDLTTAYTEA